MKRKILYVEDDPVNALIVVKLLKNDFEMTHLVDGEAAVALLKNQSFDLILMDINLGKGKMDGIQTLQAVRSMKHCLHIPVIAFTSYALPEDESRFLKEGFDDYLTKPVEKHVLTERINKFFN